MKSRCACRGTGLVELSLSLPLLLLLFVATVDIGRLIYFKQVVGNLTREAASLASRGATDVQTIASTANADAPLDLVHAGRTIVTTIVRHNADDSTPWVVRQTADGGYGTFVSRVGLPGHIALVPGIASLGPGVTVRAVEVAHRFSSAMGSSFGLLYPEYVYEVSYF